MKLGLHRFVLCFRALTASHNPLVAGSNPARPTIHTSPYLLIHEQTADGSDGPPAVGNPSATQSSRGCLSGRLGGTATVGCALAAEKGIDAGSIVTLLVRQDMAVRLERESDACVAQALADRFGIRADGSEDVHVAVAQIVKPDAGRDAVLDPRVVRGEGRSTPALRLSAYPSAFVLGPEDRCLPAFGTHTLVLNAPEGVIHCVTHRPAIREAADQIAVLVVAASLLLPLGLLGLVLAEDIGEHTRHGDFPAAPCRLRFLKPGRLGIVVETAADRDDAGVDVVRP